MRGHEPTFVPTQRSVFLGEWRDKKKKKEKPRRIDAAVLRPSRPAGRPSRLDIGSFFLDSLRRSANRVIISPKVDNVADNHLRWMGNRASFFSPSDLRRNSPLPVTASVTTTAHLLPDEKEKKKALTIARAFWTRDARYQECVMRPAIVQRNAT